MGASNRGRLRRIWFYVHMWLGVGLAVVLIPVSASGSYLVWRDEIDHALHPARYAVTSQQAALAPSAYLAAAQAAFGDRARVSALRLPADPGGPVTVTGIIGRGGRGGAEGAQGRASRGGDQAGRNEAPRAGDGDRPAGQPQGGAPRRPQTLTAWIDPGSAKVLEVANPRLGVSMWMHDLHGQLFVFGVGRQVVGWLGWLMLVSCISGIWLWWPKAGSVMKGFRWRRSPDLLTNLHYLAGFWVAIPLAVLSLTGALVSFPPFTRAVVGAFAPVTPQPAGRGPGGPGGGGAPLRDTTLTIDQVAAQVRGAYPGADLISLNLPTRGGTEPSWRAQLRTPEKATLNVTVGDTEDAVVKAPPQAQPAGDQAIRINRRIHDGGDMPIVWKLIITVAGLVPALLGVTGVIVWARRQLRKATMRGRLSAPVAEPSPAE